MSTQEHTDIPANQNIAPQSEKKWGELLGKIEEQIQAPEVTEQVEITSGAIVYGLLPWNILNPAREVVRLMKLREPANENQDIKKAA